MTIGVKRENRITRTVGPGEYSPEKAQPLTQSASRKTEFFHNGRKSIEIDPHNGPGTYIEHRNFSSNSKNMTIALKRENKILKTPGPCDYSPEKALLLTQSASRKTEFFHNGRKSKEIDPQNGPGTHEEHRNFGSDTKDMKIAFRK